MMRLTILLALLGACAFDPRGVTYPGEEGDGGALETDGMVALPTPDAAPPDAAPPDAAWSWGGIYGIEVTEPPGVPCATWNRMTVELSTVGRVWFWNTWAPDEDHWTLGSIAAPGVLHMEAMPIGAVTMTAWDAERVEDGVLVGVMAFTSGCVFDIEATRF